MEAGVHNAGPTSPAMTSAPAPSHPSSSALCFDSPLPTSSSSSSSSSQSSQSQNEDAPNTHSETKQSQLAASTDTNGCGPSNVCDALPTLLSKTNSAARVLFSSLRQVPRWSKMKKRVDTAEVLRTESMQLGAAGEEEESTVSLMTAAQNGDLDGINEQIVKNKVFVDVSLQVDEKDRGQTALIRAAKFGMLESVRLLLELGADPFVEDAHYRNAFYYVFFGAHIREGDHVKLLHALLDHFRSINKHPGKWAHQRNLASKGMKVNIPRRDQSYMIQLSEDHNKWSSVALQAAYCNRDDVTRVFLDDLGHYIVSRDSNDVTEMEFYGLHLLDNPHAKCVWPDGSRTREGETVFHVLKRKNRGEMMSHPTVLALLHWKWERCMKFVCSVELCILLGLLASVFSLCRALHVREGSELHQEPWWHYVSQGFAMVSFVLLILWDYNRLLVSNSSLLTIKVFNTPLLPSVRSAAKGAKRILLSYMCPGLFLYYLYARRGNCIRGEIDALVLMILLIWMRIATFFSISRKVGPFLIMVQRMVMTDVMWYMMILGILMPPFLVGFNLLNILDRDKQSVKGDVTSMLLTGLGFADGIEADTLADDAILCGLFLMYIIVVPLLAVNLLIAMMNDTYSKVQGETDIAWALSFAGNARKCERVSCWINKSIQSSAIVRTCIYPVLVLFDFPFHSVTYVHKHDRKFKKFYRFHALYRDFFWNASADEDDKTEEKLTSLEDRLHEVELKTDRMLALLENIHFAQVNAIAQSSSSIVWQGKW